MKQINRFFGLHFDFHAGNDVEIGCRTNEEDIEAVINSVKPDFIQCDSKGHPGNSSYPTKIGKAADMLVKDNLKIWCNAAKKCNIPIYVHHSGIFDTEYTKKNPKEAQAGENGDLTPYASLFGNYAKTYLIPQIIELIDEYDIDGVWMDGECWALYSDYSENAKKYIPENISQSDRDKLMREAFTNYLKECSQAFHAHKPDFVYISNWAYSSYMPDKPEERVLDSLSGDNPPADGVYATRYEGRCLAAQNMPWDLMCWNFIIELENDNFFIMKTKKHLEQEAAAVLMLGGGFQVYIPQNPDGSIKRIDYTSIKSLSEFVKKRKMLYQKKLLAQTAVYYSAHSRYKNSKIYNAAGSTEALIGVINAVLNAQYTVNVVLEHQAESFSDYGIVIIPEWTDMCGSEKKKLLDYMQNGGKLLIIGAEVCRQLAADAGIEVGEMIYDKDNFSFDGEKKTRKKYTYLKGEDGRFEQITGDVLDLKCGEDMLYYNSDLRDEYVPSYRICDYGKGAAAFIPFDFGKSFFALRSTKKRDFIKKVMKELEEPSVEINKKHIDISVLENENGIIVNLLNMYQNRSDMSVDIYDEIEPIYDIEIKINGHFDNVKMPLGEKFDFEISEDFAKIKLQKLDIHSVIELENSI